MCFLWDVWNISAFKLQILSFPVKKIRKDVQPSLGIHGGLVLGLPQWIPKPMDAQVFYLTYSYFGAFWNFFPLPWILSVCSWSNPQVWNTGDMEAACIEILGTFLWFPFSAVLKLLFDYWLEVSLHICWLTLLLFFVWGKKQLYIKILLLLVK